MVLRRASLQYFTTHTELVRIQQEAIKERRAIKKGLENDKDWTGDGFVKESESMVSNWWSKKFTKIKLFLFYFEKVNFGIERSCNVFFYGQISCKVEQITVANKVFVFIRVKSLSIYVVLVTCTLFLSFPVNLLLPRFQIKCSFEAFVHLNGAKW